MEEKTSKAGNVYYKCPEGDFWANAQGDVKASEPRQNAPRKQFRPSPAPPVAAQNRDEQIFAQVCMKAAADVFSGTGNGDGCVELFKRLYLELALPVIEGKPIPYHQRKLAPTPQQAMQEGEEDITF
jgi:hypothetical protein